MLTKSAHKNGVEVPYGNSVLLDFSENATQSRRLGKAFRLGAYNTALEKYVFAATHKHRGCCQGVRVCVPGCAIHVRGCIFIIPGLNRPGWPLKNRKIDHFLCSQNTPRSHRRVKYHSK